ncbi:MAG: dTDP-glucose 4,6-dehydratase [Chlamydiia bacterium]|nr:dTDP-glucose 4,6-dehydratase [Chlamydiia bacterium]
MRNPRHILITGGAGFIGSAFLRHVLKQEGFDGKAVVLDKLTYAGNLETLEEDLKDPRVRFVQGDINDQKLVSAIILEHKIDTIAHFAAESHVDRSIVSPEAFMQTNVMGTFHLLEAVRKHPNIHFHHVSTDEVYGSLGDTGAFTEETPYNPSSPYSASKAASDHLVRAYHRTYGLSAVISNCSNNYGPYQFPEKLIPLMILNCLRKKPLPIYGKGNQVRDWLYVDDHATCLWELMKHGKPGETYNVGGEQELSNLELVEKIIEIVAKLTEEDPKELRKLLAFVKDRPGHDHRYAIDCSKVKREIGWHPSPSLDERLKETVKWVLDHKPWIDHIESGSYREWIASNYDSR